MTWALPEPAGEDEPLWPELVTMMDRLFVPIAPGVEGWVVDEPGAPLEVAGIRAAEPRIPGAVGTYLDALPRDRAVAVPCVVSIRLRGMLARRGFDLVDDHGTWYRMAR